MTTLSIPDMSCGHCKAAVETAIRKLDPGAQVQVDLTTRRAEITSSQTVPAMIAALAAVGFPAEPA
ncbi:copper chaperone [Pseudorhodobacter sp. E13]|uniref:heavy-metal-associated domain-containing protein n=1 Tax=Pseudorhodobacter sp. E13 TaxID=2487931 RepID=UPI000F8CA93A|nr:heavy-metal-associated domain-containing protein [Pseudorhodobacter sp. E13]RUS58653.1 copper chaperone [Pseudorhodobacter sp. E13]